VYIVINLLDDNRLSAGFLLFLNQSSKGNPSKPSKTSKKKSEIKKKEKIEKENDVILCN